MGWSWSYGQVSVRNLHIEHLNMHDFEIAHRILQIAQIHKSRATYNILLQVPHLQCRPTHGRANAIR